MSSIWRPLAYLNQTDLAQIVSMRTLKLHKAKTDAGPAGAVRTEDFG